MGNRDKSHVGKLDNELLSKVNLSPLNKYNLFQPAKRLYIFSIMSLHIEVDLYDATKGRPKYFIGSIMPTKDISQTFYINHFTYWNNF